ncbi:MULTISPECIES: head GIN domain-containing protein [unclassified Roseateles]|uniref:head GIN domain-containing protein n=1 Tax=unclassified Roseateles TaxID=2626991 RepID=UPI0006FC308E|nr:MULTISPECIES: head GIN domain-containing protein [unclassified Roseateles]KQW46669.1 hypothetical protein ASC81_09845 [Pelomonas sp. Root405]KRA73721.1 hypothetical protein ASD88_09845 [Pelomonas sp. Root662]
MTLMRLLPVLLLATGLAGAQPAPPAAAAPAAPSAQPAQPASPPRPHLQPRPLPLPHPAPVVRPAPPLPPAGEGRVYAPGPFDRLELAGAARVVLVQGDRDQAFIAGDEEVLKSVEVELVDRQLVIRPAGGWKFWHSSKLFVQVEMRELRQLSLTGASDVHAPGPLRCDQLLLSISGAGVARLDQLDARQITFAISGAGDGRLGGRVDDLALQISGKGKVSAERLQAQRARVNVSGIGNVALWVTDDLAAHISGIGSVDYYGNPAVQRSVSGMGSISARGARRH